MLTTVDYTNRTIALRRELADGAQKIKRKDIGSKWILAKSSLLQLLPHKVREIGPYLVFTQVLLPMLAELEFGDVFFL